MCNNAEQILDFFQKHCRDMDGVYDVILRGSLSCSEFISDWSDIDLSIIVNKNEFDVWNRLRKIAIDARLKFNVKISITVVELLDSSRIGHNHGIKPSYYSTILSNTAMSLLGKPLPFASTCNKDRMYDCYHNLLYLVHDIRSNYLSLNPQSIDFVDKCRHILKRTKYVIKNALIIFGNSNELYLEVCEIARAIQCTNVAFIDQILHLKQHWSEIKNNDQQLLSSVTHSIVLCSSIMNQANKAIDGRHEFDPLNIVIFTDCTDVASSEIYGQLHTLLHNNNIKYNIAPVIHVENFSIINAAFLVRLMANIYSKNSIFLVIVNATNDNPVRIFGETCNGIKFVGNNSGYFSWLFDDFGISEVYLTHNNREYDNRSFGGRNVQVPTVVDIATKKNLNVIGEKIVDYSMLKKCNILQGTIVHIDNFGLMKFLNVCNDEIRSSSSIDVFINNEFVISARFSNKMKTCKDGEWIIFEGSSLNPPLLELAKVRCRNSALAIGAKIGDVITMKIKH